MSDYRRLISYIYEYEGKEKGKNIGYAKLETRNGQCRIHVNVKRVYVGGNAIGVYLLGKGGTETLLGNMFVRNGNGEFRTTVSEGNVEGTGEGMDTYYGLTVHDVKNAWRSYRTIWEDVETVKAAEVMAQDILPGNSGEDHMPDVGTVIEELEQEITGEDIHEQLKEETQEFVTEPVGSEAEPTESEAEPVESKTIGSETESVESMMISPELENPDVLRYLQETERQTTDPEMLWEKLRKMYPKIQPFEYDGGSEVLTIRPEDIGHLPRENWIYGNNSFLLHGYYNFRYLILVRLNRPNGETRYLIGVPGHYYSNEKYMATMFGFPNFVLSKKQPLNDGRFGYWYTDIKMY